MRRLVCGLLLCAVASLGTAADKAVPVEKRFALSNGQSLVIRLPTGWGESTDARMFKGAPPGTVGLRGPDPKQMQFLIGPWQLDPSVNDDVENLRKSTRYLAQTMEQQPATQVNHEQQPLDGPNVRGFYVKGVDDKPKPDEYRYMYVGTVLISSRACLIQVAWNDGAEATAKQAIAAIATARIQ